MKSNIALHMMVALLTLAMSGCRTAHHYNQDEIVAAVLEVSTVFRTNSVFSEADCKSDLGKSFLAQCTDANSQIPLQWISKVVKVDSRRDCFPKDAPVDFSAVHGVAYIFPYGFMLHDRAFMILGTTGPANISFYSFTREGVVSKLNHRHDDGDLLYDLVPKRIACHEDNGVYIYGWLLHTQQERLLKVGVYQGLVEIAKVQTNIED